MKCKIEIKMDGAAFTSDADGQNQLELGRILHELAGKIESGGELYADDKARANDTNGNPVATLEITE